MKKYILTLMLTLAVAFSGITGGVFASSPDDVPSSGEGVYSTSTETSEPTDPDDPDPKDPDTPLTPTDPDSKGEGDQPQGPFPPEKEVQ